MKNEMTHDEVIKNVIEIKNGNTLLLYDLMKKCSDLSDLNTDI